MATTSPISPISLADRFVDGINVTALAASWVATLSPNRVPLPGYYHLDINIRWTDAVHRCDEMTYLRLDNPPVNVTWRVTVYGGFSIAASNHIADRMADAIGEAWIHGVWEGTGRVHGQSYRWRVDRVELWDAEWPQGDAEHVPGWDVGWSAILALLAERLAIQTDPAYHTGKGGVLTHHVIE